MCVKLCLEKSLLRDPISYVYYVQGVVRLQHTYLRWNLAKTLCALRRVKVKMRAVCLQPDSIRFMQGVIARDTRLQRLTLADGLLKWIWSTSAVRQNLHTNSEASAGLSMNRDLVRIATKSCDVVMYPF